MRSGQKVRHHDQVFQVLGMLVELQGEVVTREELLKHHWPSDTFVDFDQGLNVAVKKLRRALDDSAETPQFIETLARRGYRFVATVKEVGVADGHQAATSSAKVGEESAEKNAVTASRAAAVMPANRANRHLLPWAVAAIL